MTDALAAHFAKAEDLLQAGVKGMKWGVRKSRSTGGDADGEAAPKKVSADVDTVRRIKQKKLTEMSNIEIQQINKRLQLERQYRELNPGVITRGQQIVNRTLDVANTAQRANSLYRSSDVAALRQALLAVAKK